MRRFAASFSRTPKHPDIALTSRVEITMDTEDVDEVSRREMTVDTEDEVWRRSSTINEPM